MGQVMHVFSTDVSVRSHSYRQKSFGHSEHEPIQLVLISAKISSLSFQEENIVTEKSDPLK